MGEWVRERQGDRAIGDFTAWREGVFATWREGEWVILKLRITNYGTRSLEKRRGDREKG